MSHPKRSAQPRMDYVISLPPKVWGQIDKLTDTGLWGKDNEETAEQLICAKLRDLLKPTNEN